MMRRLLSDKSGGSAAEFGMVLPLLIILLFTLIDVGRWMWTYNRAEKAAQMGARYAIVTNVLDPGLRASYVGVGGLVQGDVIPASAFGKLTCTSTGCSCSTTPCPTAGTFDSTSFTKIVDRMKLFLPNLTSANVAVEYTSSGLGYAGTPPAPSGSTALTSDLSPIVTVSIGKAQGTTRLQFKPIVALKLRAMDMPYFTSSLTAEDMSGSVSN